LGACETLAAQEAPEYFSADGYRIAEFRTPVPDSVPAAITITTQQLESLLQEKQKVLLIDVMPTPVKPKDRPDNLLWLPPTRRNIAGSYWLPNVGFGALSTELNLYFKQNLERLSEGEKSRKIVLYCLANCWMSWNAAKRAAMEYGYSHIYWYPDGTTGWEAAGLPLEASQPIPMEEP
jgi:PQQ-dependent catabolism-associated CXXCW motif protein